MPIAANFIGYIPPIWKKNPSFGEYIESTLGVLVSTLWKKNPSFGEYIEYQVLNPATMKMERQRIRLTTMT